MSRYTLIPTQTNPATLLGIALTGIPAEFLVPRYNIARNQNIIVLRAQAESFKPDIMRWGFVPHWIHCSDPILQPLTVPDAKLQQPYFRNAFALRRCLVPASGFYAWPGWENGPGNPYYVQPKNNEPLLMAALWDTAEGVDHVAIITTAANTLIHSIHHSMPAIIPLDSAMTWLCGKNPGHLLQPYPATEMQIHMVSRKVFNDDNEGPELIKPVAEQPRHTHA